MNRNRVSKVLLALAILCLAFALVMSVDMGAFGRWAIKADDLAFLIASGYVVFMLAALILWDGGGLPPERHGVAGDGNGVVDEHAEEDRGEQDG